MLGAIFGNSQVDGWYRFKIGGFEATVLWDGYINHSYDGIYPNADPAELARLREQYLLKSEHFQMDVNPVVVNTGKQVILVDAGMGRRSDLFGKTLGRASDNLGAAGLRPDDIDAVLITHFHPDHCGGLLKPDGSAAFPNAKVYATKTDWDEWTAPKNLTYNDHRAPWSQIVLDAVAPYRERMVFFEAGDALFDGVTTISIAGHSSGMCAFLFESAGEKCLFTGDLCHHSIFDPYHPEWFFHLDLDSDPVLGAKAKKETFAKIVRESIQLHGYHFEYPGLGDLVEFSNGRYRFVPHPVNPRWD